MTYWGLGNEVDGDWQMGHRSAEDYSKFALEAAKLMKWSDHSIKLVASGSSDYRGDWIGWNRTVLNTLHDQIDYISLHHYAANREKDNAAFMGVTKKVEDIIVSTEGLINQTRTQYQMTKPIYIAFDEYNVWYRAGEEQKLEEHYNLQDALVIAMYLNTFVRHANIVKMANMAQLVNVIAPMMVTGDKLWLQTIYYPLQLFADHCKGASLQALVQCDHYDAGTNKQIPYLDVSAAYNDQMGELVINVVNRHAEKPVQAAIENQFGKLAAEATVYSVNSGDLMDENSVTEQKVKIQEQQIKLEGNSINYSFPPHSFTMITVKVK